MCDPSSFTYFYFSVLSLHWCCWFGDRKSIRSVKSLHGHGQFPKVFPWAPSLTRSNSGKMGWLKNWDSGVCMMQRSQRRRQRNERLVKLERKRNKHKSCFANVRPRKLHRILVNYRLFLYCLTFISFSTQCDKSVWVNLVSLNSRATVFLRQILPNSVAQFVKLHSAIFPRYLTFRQHLVLLY